MATRSTRFVHPCITIFINVPSSRWPYPEQVNYDVGLMSCNTIHTLVYITSYTYRNHRNFKRRQAASKPHRPKRPHEVKTREDYETSPPFKDWPTLKTTSPSGTFVHIYQSHGATYQWTVICRSYTFRVGLCCSVTLQLLTTRPFSSHRSNNSVSTFTSVTMEVTETNYHDQSTYQINL